MLRTGMRLGEIIALKPGDLDFVGNFIEVRKNCVRGLIGTPKSGKVRRVDMSAGLKEVLQAYFITRKREALRKGWSEPPEWLFYKGSGCMTYDIHMLH